MTSIYNNYGPSYKKETVKTIIESLQNNQNPTLLGIEDDGRSDFLRYLINSPQLKEIYKDFYKNFEFIILDCSFIKEFDFKECLEYLYSQITSKVEELSPIQMKLFIEKYIYENPSKKVFVLNKCQKIKSSDLFSFLSHIRSNHKGKINFLFSAPINFDIENLDELQDCFNEKILHFGLLTEKDEKATISTRYSKAYIKKLNFKKIFSISGGHAGLTKICYDFDISNIDEAFSNTKILKQLELIYKSFDEQLIKEAFKFIFLKDENSKNFYDKNKLITENGELISPLFEKYILRNSNFNTDGEKIFVNQINITKYFTQQQTKVISLLISNVNNKVHRGDIGKAIWGNSQYQDYSDAAVDKLISDLRKKILIFPYKISTISKYGYQIERI